MFQVHFYGRAAALNKTEFMTAGSVGIKIAFGFDEQWSGLTKTATFRGSGRSCDVLIGSGEEMLVPPEVMARAGGRVEVGVFGSNGQGTVVIPTVWVVLGTVEAGAKLSGTSAAEITPTLAEQVLAAVEAAQEAAEAAQEAAEAAAAAQIFTAEYIAIAEIVAGEGTLIFVEHERYDNIKAAILAGHPVRARVKVGDKRYYAELTEFFNPSQEGAMGFVVFDGNSLMLCQTSTNYLEGKVYTGNDPIK